MVKATLNRAIARKEAKLAKIEERLGQLMTERADEEESLAQLYKKRNAMRGAQPGTVR